jgi:hypothetical protein
MSEHVTGEQDHSEYIRFENELKVILNACEHAGVLVRVFGSMAFQIHCPQYGYLQTHPYSDIDLAAYIRHSRQIREILTKLGYVENRKVFVLSEAQRALFHKGDDNLRVEIFYEKLDFCHALYWRDRLEADSPTIPLAELFLEKMQIVHISEKDVVNTIMLLLEHPLGETDNETINIKLAAQLCADEWGLWRTVTMNLGKVRQFAQQYAPLTPEQKSRVAAQVDESLLRLHQEPKPLAWKVRDHMGDRVQWYKDVEDV